MQKFAQQLDTLRRLLPQLFSDFANSIQRPFKTAALTAIIAIERGLAKLKVKACAPSTTTKKRLPFLPNPTRGRVCTIGGRTLSPFSSSLGKKIHDTPMGLVSLWYIRNRSYEVSSSSLAIFSNCKKDLRAFLRQVPRDSKFSLPKWY